MTVLGQEFLDINNGTTLSTRDVNQITTFTRFKLDGDDKDYFIFGSSYSEGRSGPYTYAVNVIDINGVPSLWKSTVINRWPYDDNIKTITVSNEIAIVRNSRNTTGIGLKDGKTKWFLPDSGTYVIGDSQGRLYYTGGSGGDFYQLDILKETKAPTSLAPTSSPTLRPTNAPTPQPSDAPTNTPTTAPTTNGPTSSPTQPTKPPTKPPIEFKWYYGLIAGVGGAVLLGIVVVGIYYCTCRKTDAEYEPVPNS
jgi:hypothetical protein